MIPAIFGSSVAQINVLLGGIIASMLSVGGIWVKDESQLPTGSFKSRGQAIAITMARRFGVTRVAIPTAGNAGGALAAATVASGLPATHTIAAGNPARVIRPLDS